MFKTIIGLEIHAQLQTATKAFCSCPNHSQASPNSNVCPICTGQPGTLPSLNQKMVEMALKTSLAFECTIRKHISFDRKHYFSPDMPKCYQITQYLQPIGEDGFVEVMTKNRKKKIAIIRIHMEEDSARSIIKTDPQTKHEITLFDLNRSGIPLLEIVTAPELNSPQEAVECFETIRSILMYLDVCDGHLEAGSLRCDANISIQDTQSDQSTGRVEIKNLSTFKNLERALLYEERILKKSFTSFSSDKAITKNWDENLRQTLASREKESFKDYRYFKEPDLPDIILSDDLILSIKDYIPELPLKRLERLRNDYNLRYDIAKAIINNRSFLDFFERAMNILNTNEMKHLIIRDVKHYLNQTGKQITETQLTPEKLYQFLKNIKTGKIAPMTKTKILKTLFETSKSIDTIIEEENLIKIDNKLFLSDILEDIINKNEEQYEAYTCGKKELFKWFVGQMIKRTKGRADPKLIISIIQERMEG